MLLMRTAKKVKESEPPVLANDALEGTEQVKEILSFLQVQVEIREESRQGSAPSLNQGRYRMSFKVTIILRYMY